jgi:hypothetical protein
MAKRRSKARLSEVAHDVASVVTSLVTTAVHTKSLPLTLAPKLVAIGFKHASKRVQARAEKMVRELLDADERPSELADWIDAKVMEEDEHVAAAFHALLVASAESITPAALAPIGIIGRAYLKNECEAWVARGWLRVLSEVTAEELRGVRDAIAVLRTKQDPSGFELADLQDALIPFPRGDRTFGAVATGWALDCLTCFDATGSRPATSQVSSIIGKEQSTCAKP